MQAPSTSQESTGRRSLFASLITVPNLVALAGLTVLLLIVGIGSSSWRGFGFDADGPELPLLRNALALRAGMTVADVGAGYGDLTVVLSREVGASGRVYANDLDLAQVRATVAAAGILNVTFVQSQPDNTTLPDGCCDAIVMRRVYHHLTEPVAINASLLRALRPGGVLAVIDFPAPVSWLWPLNHGVDAGRVSKEVVASGFRLVDTIEHWPGRGPLQSYCLVFRKAQETNR